MGSKRLLMLRDVPRCARRIPSLHSQSRSMHPLLPHVPWARAGGLFAGRFRCPHNCAPGGVAVLDRSFRANATTGRQPRKQRGPAGPSSYVGEKKYAEALSSWWHMFSLKGRPGGGPAVSWQQTAAAVYACEQLGEWAEGLRILNSAGIDRATASSAASQVDAAGGERLWTMLLRMQCLASDEAGALRSLSHMGTHFKLRPRMVAPVLDVCADKGHVAIAEALWAACATEFQTELRESELLSMLRCYATAHERTGLPDRAERVHRLLDVARDHIVCFTEAAAPKLLAACERLGFGVEETTVNASGSCHECSGQLGAFPFSSAMKDRLLRDIGLLLAMGKSTPTDARQSLDRFLSQQRYTTVVDGANVGYCSAGAAWHPGMPIDYRFVDQCLTQLEASHHVPFIVLHGRHVRIGGDVMARVSKDGQTPFEAASLVAKWQRRGRLFVTPPGVNDDILWLHAAVSLTTPDDRDCGGGPAPWGPWFVSNDAMRDHRYEMLHPRYLFRWRDRHRITFAAHRAPGSRTATLEFTLPRSFSNCMQPTPPLSSTPGRAWHIPVTASGGDVVAWLCLSLR